MHPRALVRVANGLLHLGPGAIRVATGLIPTALGIMLDFLIPSSVSVEEGRFVPVLEGRWVVLVRPVCLRVWTFAVVVAPVVVLSRPIDLALAARRRRVDPILELRHVPSRG